MEQFLGQLRLLGGVADGARRPHGETSSSLAPPPGLSTRFLTRWARVSPGSQTRRGGARVSLGRTGWRAFLSSPSPATRARESDETIRFFSCFIFPAHPTRLQRCGDEEISGGSCNRSTSFSKNGRLIANRKVEARSPAIAPSVNERNARARRRRQTTARDDAPSTIAKPAEPEHPPKREREKKKKRT